MKYKVGDKVRIIDERATIFKLGDIVEIIEITKSENTMYIYKCSKGSSIDWLTERHIVKAVYTWEDFLKCPIGTKVTFERGKVIYKMEKDEYGDEFANMSDNFSYEELEGFKIKYSDYGKIIKIEEPTYTTVYEPNEEVEEMTLEEICKELGREIKIVKEK